jgi:predicted DNA-binding protein YlxM (UPF0122 family)
MNLEERAYRVALMWGHGLRSFDAADIFDYQNACHVNRDYQMYKQAMRYGLGSIVNPPSWLARTIKREKGAMRHGFPPAAMNIIRETLTHRQLLGMAVMTQTGLSSPQAAKLFKSSRQAINALLKRGYKRLAKRLGLTEEQTRSLISEVTSEDWEKIGMKVG